MARNQAYRKAEQKIEEARRTGATKLDLSNDLGTPDEKKLTELPESLWQLTQLQSLSLSHNNLTAVPDTIGQLIQLQSLNLYGNQLTAVPDAIGQLTQLQSLNLGGNQLTAVPATIGKLALLQTLNLGSNKLTAVPDTIGKLTELQSLNLSDNRLTAVPDTIGQLTQLQTLYLRNNQLKTLTDALGQLTRLKELHIAGNKLEVLPEFLSQLFQLKELYVFSNSLQSIPDWIGELHSLEWLNIQENDIADLPITLCKLKFMRGLVLGWSKESKGIPISKLPDWIGNLTSLEELYAASCKLSSLPPSFTQLEHLKKLELGNNPLNAELAAAYEEGIEAVKAYLHAKAGMQIRLNEAKLILVGEGEVGKTCLMDALEGLPWEEHPTTHGIEIRPIAAVDPVSGAEITLNGWDFGGQRVYRPTHQLFFSSPASCSSAASR